MAEDRYANIATINVVMSAANTLTFSELSTQLGIQADRKSAIAMLIDQIDYFPSLSDFALMTTAADNLQYGLTISNGVTNLASATDRRIMHSMFVHRVDLGTAGSGQLHLSPYTHQFFPPLILAERTLYLGMSSNGLGAVGSVTCRIYYRTTKLTESELLEITEVFRLVS